MERGVRAFTLVELLVVIVILAVVAAIAIPKINNGSAKSKEAQLASNLKLVRQSIQNFYVDTGAYPMSLSDLARPTAPAQVTSSTYPASRQAYPAGVPWQGPYLDKVPTCPISKSDFQVTTVAGPGNTLIYGVRSTSTETGSNGTAYNTW